MLEPDKIYEMDCFAAMTEVPDGSVDVVLTDPPYPNRMNLFPDTLIDGISMLYLSCKKAKNFVVFFWNPFDIPPPPAGWHEVAKHVWHKPDTKSITHYEIIVVWSKVPRQKVSRVWTIAILDYRSLHEWKPHPTQKPVRLIRYLLETVTKEGDLVLDPFVGTGTTAVACKQMKRHYIGIDKDPKYTQIANDRLKDKAAAKEDNEPPDEKATEGESDDSVEPPATSGQQKLPRTPKKPDQQKAKKRQK